MEKRANSKAFRRVRRLRAIIRNHGEQLIMRGTKGKTQPLPSVRYGLSGIRIPLRWAVATTLWSRSASAQWDSSPRFVRRNRVRNHRFYHRIHNLCVVDSTSITHEYEFPWSKHSFLLKEKTKIEISLRTNQLNFWIQRMHELLCNPCKLLLDSHPVAVPSKPICPS